MANRDASSTTSYAWQGMTFALPAGLHDQSVLQFAGDPQTYNLVVTRESLEGAALPIFIQARIRELSALLPSYALQGQTERKLGDRLCSILTQDVTTPDGIKVRQVQAYVAEDDAATIFTATTPAEDSSWATEAIDNLLASLKF